MVAFKALVTACLLACVWSKCPEPNEVKDLNGEKVCARLFEHSNVIYEQCCGGDFFDIPNPSDVPIIEWGWNDRASSLVVSTRCELVVWNRRNKEGYKRKFRSGIQYRLSETPKGLFRDWDNSITGYYCVCK